MMLAPAIGALLIALVGVDVFRTVLLPVSSGHINRVISRVLWQLALLLPPRRRSGLMTLAGPLSIILTTATWLTVMWFGFALIYLPAVDSLAYSSDARFDPPGLFEALYLSGTSLTTLGFGDVVGQTRPVRLLTVFEAAAGIGILTATLGYLPALYTLVSELRSANQAVADLGAEEPSGAAELLGVDGALVLDEVRRDVIAARQHLQRFPVLHYFHPPYDESVVALARGAVGLWVAGHFAEDEHRPLHRHVEALGQALRRLVDELVANGGGGATSPDSGQAVALFEQARTVSTHPEAARAIEIDQDALTLLERLDAALDAYATAHDLPGERRNEP